MSGREVYEKIKDELILLYGAGEAASISAIVLEDGFGIKKGQYEISSFDEHEFAQITSIISRLLKNEPVQYVLNKAIFFGLPFYVDKNVLIPRQETEELVAWIIETVSSEPSEIHRIVDVGTGSGCIPVTLKKKLNSTDVSALDISEAALQVAKINADNNQVKLIFIHSDILDEEAWIGLPEFDLVVSNPPYISESEKELMPANVLQFEPHLALFAEGNDALIFYRKITAFAKLKLCKGGWLFFETNEFNAEGAKKILLENNFSEVELRKDLNGKYRMLRGQKNSN